MDCVIETTAHNAFKEMKLEALKRLMNDKPVLIDVSGLFDHKMAEKEGFYYKSL